MAKCIFLDLLIPSDIGLNSTIQTTATSSIVDITPYGSNAITATNQGMQFFAGPRDDPFFFDFGQFNEIIAGNASGFNSPGTDTFCRYQRTIYCH